MRDLPPVSDFPTFFAVTPIVLSITKASMRCKIQNPKFLQVQPLVTLAIKSEHVMKTFQIKNKF